MCKQLGKIIAFLGAVFALFLRANFVFALEVTYPPILGKTLNDTSSLGDFVCYLFSFGAGITVSIAAATIIYGGALYLLSYGRGKFTTESKEIIKAGITGLLIILCAFLIIKTINPELTKCNISFLPNFNIFPSSNSPDIPPGAKIITYKEIPLGILTENLLTKTTNCYGFDETGAPVDGDKIKTDSGDEIPGPTFLDHDRADCLVQLTDGAQKKAALIAGLSNEINKLMDQCKCKDPATGASKCDPVCGGQCNLYNSDKSLGSGAVCAPGLCAGDCVKGNPLSGCKTKLGQTGDCCPAGVKDKIETGGKDGINVSVEVGETNNNGGKCKTKSVAKKGLDEFRSKFDNNFDRIKDTVEQEVTVNDKKIQIIKSSSWDSLLLIDQLTYLKGKIDELEQNIQSDKTQLAGSASELAKCYLAIPYIDLLKIRQSTDQAQTYIKINKTTDSSKYCAGFNYNNSSCLKKCNDMCPDTSPEAILAYGKCANNSDKNISQEKCIENAYNSRPCTYSDKKSADGKPQKFSECISSCQGDCKSNCAKLYTICSDEYKFCASSCGNNSQCVLTNASECLFNAQNFTNCAKTAPDQGNKNYCINNAYFCKNGSDQFAGYPDCVESAVITKCAAIESQGSCQNTDGCFWDGNYCLQNSSASFLYDNPKNEKCYDSAFDFVNSYNSAEKGSDCYSQTSPDASCIGVCPEISKCPANSKCPDCPCDQLRDSSSPTKKQNINFYVPLSGIGQYKTSTESISARQIAGPECNGYSYNDDPLTFYCEGNKSCKSNKDCPSGQICSASTNTCSIGSGKNCSSDTDCPSGTGEICDSGIDRCVRDGQYAWYDDPNKEQNATPIGAERTCSKSQEIPIGQTVDGAKNWADNLISNADTVKKGAQKMIDQMTKIGTAGVVGKAYNYCKCDAKHDTGNTPVCTTDCKFNPPDVNGNNCNCEFVPCEGSPCEQMADYLSELWGDYGELKNNFITFYTTMLTEPRSDIIKELSYSRQQTNQCSTVNNTSGLIERLLNCTRAMDEIISPIKNGYVMFNNQKINNYCYGKYLGKLFNQPLTDNWYCCQSTVKDPTPRQGQTQ